MKISIITVSYNAEKCIERTIKSVLEQNYSDLEYLIIDGGSTDRTINIIDKYKDKISLILSEPDNGIYDAMNKGAKLASGEWINFMNCGDCFHTPFTVSNIFNSVISRNEYAVLYGRTLLTLSYAKYIIDPEPLNLLNSRMPFCHQSCFVKRMVLLDHLFNLKYTVAADHNQFLEIYREGIQFLYIPVIISQYFAEGGFSMLNSLKAYNELSEITNINKSKFYVISVIKMKIRDFVLKILPITLQNRIRIIKYNSNTRFHKYE